MLEVSYKIVGSTMRARSRVISEQLPEQRAESIDGPGSVDGPGFVDGPGSIDGPGSVVDGPGSIGRNPITKAPLDHEAQTGFRSNRGTCDGTWNVGMAIAKRKEHGAESWVLLLDLVKAFDRVPRELLWEVMKRFGYPPKFMRILIKLHTGVKVNFSMHGVEKEVSSTIGAKQGDLLGPDLFNIHIAAVMQIWRARYNGTKCTFRTKQDFVLGTGTRGNTRKWDMGGKRGRSSGVEEFEVSDSEYADDTALIFSSREELEHWSPLLITTFADCGMEVHIKQPGDGKKPKTIVLFVAVQGCEYDRYHTEQGGRETMGGTDLSDVKLPCGGVIPVVEKAVYLGTTLSREGTCNKDVDSRANKAAAAFGRLPPLVFKNKDISMNAKKVAYIVIIVSILLYGCELWAPTAAGRRKLRAFLPPSVCEIELWD